MYKNLFKNRLTQIIGLLTLAILSYLLSYDFDNIVPSSTTDTNLIGKIPHKKYNLRGVVSLSDGDSLKFKKLDQRIRLFAIDSPELAQKCGIDKQQWPCGQRAKFALNQKINGQKVTCIGDEKDKHARLIATCYIAINDKGYEDLNAWMVKKGWAIAYTHYSNRYIKQQKYAKQNQLGIWRSEFLEPYKWRKKYIKR